MAAPVIAPSIRSIRSSSHGSSRLQPITPSYSFHSIAGRANPNKSHIHRFRFRRSRPRTRCLSQLVRSPAHARIRYVRPRTEAHCLPVACTMASFGPPASYYAATLLIEETLPKPRYRPLGDGYVRVRQRGPPPSHQNGHSCQPHRRRLIVSP